MAKNHKNRHGGHLHLHHHHHHLHLGGLLHHLQVATAVQTYGGLKSYLLQAKIFLNVIISRILQSEIP